MHLSHTMWHIVYLRQVVLLHELTHFVVASPGIGHLKRGRLFGSWSGQGDSHRRDDLLLVKHELPDLGAGTLCRTWRDGALAMVRSCHHQDIL